MNLRVTAGVLILFLLQTYLVVAGAPVFTKYWNPLLLLVNGIALSWIYLYVHSNPKPSPARIAAKWERLLAPVLVLICLILVVTGFTNNFQKFPDPGGLSDVNPQLEILFARFRRGEQPYYTIIQSQSKPFPAYMPLHWLPIGLPRLLKIDTRWIGPIIFSAVMLLYGWQNRKKPVIGLVAALPLFVLWRFVQIDAVDMADTLELVVASYYLLLAAGLNSNNYWLITIGLISCILSRYTLVFWLPVLAVLLWLNAPKKTSFIVWGATAGAVLVLYVIPFLVHKPSIFWDGVRYHNNCAIFDWQGSGNPPVSWTLEDGVSFGADLKAILPGDSARQVAYVRILQGILMLALMAGGIFFYRRLKDRIPVAQYSLALLYLFIITFYLFSPLTYKYYWISPLMIAAVITGGVISNSRNFKRDSAILQNPVPG